jgi:hypothetical protein
MLFLNRDQCYSAHDLCTHRDCLPAPFHNLSSLLRIDHQIVQRCIVWDTDSIVNERTNAILKYFKLEQTQRENKQMK